MTETRKPAPEKQYSPEQLANAEELAKTLSELSPEKQSTVTMMANAFIGGMEAQARLASPGTSGTASSRLLTSYHKIK